MSRQFDYLALVPLVFDPNDQYQTPDGDVLQAENYYYDKVVFE